MFPLAQKYVEKVILVEDDEIVAAQRALWNELRVAAEAGGAAAYAGLKKYRPEKNEKVGVLICGGNTTAVKF
jgi:threonine dehydratase